MKRVLNLSGRVLLLGLLMSRMGNASAALGTNIPKAVKAPARACTRKSLLPIRHDPSPLLFISSDLCCVQFPAACCVIDSCDLIDIWPRESRSRESESRRNHKTERKQRNTVFS
jgi:hypothetical protein